MEKKIIDLALEKMEQEKNILIDVARGVSTSSLVEKYGLF